MIPKGTLSPRDTQRARIYVGSLWAIAGIGFGLAVFGSSDARETSLGLLILLAIGLILWLVTYRDRGGNWLLLLFAIALAFSEGGFAAAGLPVGSLLPVMIVVAWSFALVFLGEYLRRIGWFAP